VRLIAQQARAGVAVLVVSAVVVAVAVFLAAALPVAVDGVTTRQVQHDVVGSAVRVYAPLNAGESMAGPALDSADDAQWVGSRIEAGMPPDLRSVLDDQVTTILSPQLNMGTVDSVPARLRFAYVAIGDGPELTWVEGRPPLATGTRLDFVKNPVKMPVEVGLTAAVADALHVGVGDALPVVDQDEVALDVTVVGVFKAADPRDFATVPTLLEAQVTAGADPQLAATALVTAESLPFARLAVSPLAMERVYTYDVLPSELNAANAEAVATQARGLASGKQTFEIVGVSTTVMTKLDTVIDLSLDRSGAAATQASVFLVSLIALVALTQVLAATVIIDRRSRVLGLMRTRGASRRGTGLGLLAEAAVVTGIGAVLGLATQAVLVPGAVAWAWVAIPIAVSLLAAPVLGMRAVALRHAPPPALSRRRIALQGTDLRRITVEAVVIIAAIAALLALRSRGAGSSQGSVGADVVVLAAPALGALGVGVVLARLLPYISRWLRAIAGKASGPAALVAAARLKAAIAPTLAMVLAGAVVALAGSTAATVSRGLEDASWDVVGADAVAQSSLITGLPVGHVDGVTSATATDAGVGHLAGGPRSQAVTVVIVDAERLAVLEELVPGGTPEPWRELAAAPVGNNGAVPMLMSADLNQVESGTLAWNRLASPVTSIGAAPDLPGQQIAGSAVVVMDRGTLERAVPNDYLATVVWAMGADSGEVLRTAYGEGATVTTRTGWHAEALATPVTTGLTTLYWGAAVVAVAAAALAVALVVAAGAGERRAAMGRLRVIGLSTRGVGHVARAQETLPVVISGAVGVATGMALTWLLTGALGLNLATGQDQPPAPVSAWWTALFPLVIGAFAWLAVGVGVRFGRALRLGEVMRTN